MFFMFSFLYSFWYHKQQHYCERKKKKIFNLNDLDIKHIIIMITATA